MRRTATAALLLWAPALFAADFYVDCAKGSDGASGRDPLLGLGRPDQAEPDGILSRRFHTAEAGYNLRRHALAQRLGGPRAPDHARRLRRRRAAHCERQGPGRGYPIAEPTWLGDSRH